MPSRNAEPGHRQRLVEGGGPVIDSRQDWQCRSSIGNRRLPKYAEIPTKSPFGHDLNSSFYASIDAALA